MKLNNAKYEKIVYADGSWYKLWEAEFEVYPCAADRYDVDRMTVLREHHGSKADGLQGKYEERAPWVQFHGWRLNANGSRDGRAANREYLIPDDVWDQIREQIVDDIIDVTVDGELWFTREQIIVHCDTWKDRR